MSKRDSKKLKKERRKEAKKKVREQQGIQAPLPVHTSFIKSTESRITSRFSLIASIVAVLTFIGYVGSCIYRSEKVSELYIANVSTIVRAGITPNVLVELGNSGNDPLYVNSAKIVVKLNDTTLLPNGYYIYHDSLGGDSQTVNAMIAHSDRFVDVGLEGNNEIVGSINRNGVYAYNTGQMNVIAIGEFYYTNTTTKEDKKLQFGIVIGPGNITVTRHRKTIPI